MIHCIPIVFRRHLRGPMRYFTIKDSNTVETPVCALLRLNVRKDANIVFGRSVPSRLGRLIPININGHLSYHINIDRYKTQIENELGKDLGEVHITLEEITEAEFESWDIMDLFPIVKTSIAH